MRLRFANWHAYKGGAIISYEGIDLEVFHDRALAVLI